MATSRPVSERKRRCHEPSSSPRAAAARGAILAAVRALAPGRVASYGEIAARAGLAGRARLVGRVLAEADDARLPWHRVVRADGSIAFPCGTRRHAEQVRRLRRDGVVVVAGRVVARRRGGGSLDAALWGPAPPLKRAATRPRR